MKRILAFFLAICVVVSLTGCPATPIPREAPKLDPEAKFKKHDEDESRLLQVGFPVRADHVTVAIIKDKDTGAEYIVCYSNHGVAICPMKQKEGK